MENDVVKTIYSWRILWLILGLLIYWFVSVGGGISLINQMQTPVAGSAWVSLITLTYIIVCMLTERGNWKWWAKILAVIIGHLAHLVLGIPVAFLAVRFVEQGGTLMREQMSIGYSLLAGFPIVIFMMRRSKLFVKGSKMKIISE